MRWAEPTALAQEARLQPRGDGEQAAVRVVVVRPRKGEMDRTTSQPGTVQAFESVQIFAGVSGYLKTLNVDIGDTIKRGQSLATVDVPELEKEVQRRAAALDQAKARLAQMKAHVVSAKAELEAACSSVPQAQATAKSKAAELRFREKQLRQEQVRPLAPFVSVGFSTGGFGGGNDAVGPLGGRTDFDVLAVWRLYNLGFGNRAIQGRVRAERDESMAVRQRVIDQVRREVAEAMALIRASGRELESAQRQLRTATEAYRLDLDRTKNLVGAARPIEVLNSANLLNTARQDVIHALVGFDQAQFRLLVALGQPPISVASHSHSP